MRIKTIANACLLLAPLAGFTAMTTAQAATFCVASTAELQSALSAASDGGMYNGDTNFILVTQGTYTTGTGPFRYSNLAATGDLMIYGGYAPGCATRSLDASLTVLDGHHATQVMTLGSAQAEVDVVGLTIQNGEYNQRGAGLSINPTVSYDGAVLVASNIIRNNHTTSFDGGLSVAASGSGRFVFVEGNLITGNSADAGDGAGSAVANISSLAEILNNTVTLNTTITPTGNGGFSISGTGDLIVNNNIFRNNTHTGAFLGEGGITFDYNDYGTLGGIAPGESIGNLTLDPAFVDAASGNFHLSGNSPLLGASHKIYHLTDPDGHHSPAHGRMDIGAFFETIFIGDFESLAN